MPGPCTSPITVTGSPGAKKRTTRTIFWVRTPRTGSSSARRNSTRAPTSNAWPGCSPGTATASEKGSSSSSPRTMPSGPTNSICFLTRPLTITRPGKASTVTPSTRPSALFTLMACRCFLSTSSSCRVTTWKTPITTGEMTMTGNSLTATTRTCSCPLSTTASRSREPACAFSVSVQLRG